MPTYNVKSSVVARVDAPNPEAAIAALLNKLRRAGSEPYTVDPPDAFLDNAP